MSIDLSAVDSVSAAEKACRSGVLFKELLLDVEFVGSNVEQNIIYLTQRGEILKSHLSEEIFRLFDIGLVEIEIMPEHYGKVLFQES